MIAGAWSQSVADLPSGWAPGQLAVLIEVVPAFVLQLPAVPDGWMPQGATPLTQVAGMAWTWLRVSTRALRAGDAGPVAPQGAAGWSGRVVVDENGAPGVRVTMGAARVSVRDGASGVVVGAASQDVNPAGSGVSWLPGRAVVSPTSWWGPSMWVTVGEATEGTAGAATVPGLGIEFLPPVGPRPPVLTAPGAGEEINAAADTDFSWQHQPARSGGRQGGWSWRISSAFGWLYWSASSSSLTGTETLNPGDATRVTLPAGSLDNLGTARSWTARTQEALDGLLSPWAAERQVTPVTPPILTVTVVTAHGDLSPTIVGSATITRPSSTVTASHWQIRDTAGAVVWDSGVLGGAGLTRDAPASTPWSNMASYTGWGRVQQTGGAWSAWSSSAPFVVSWTAPATPVVNAGTRYTPWTTFASNFMPNPSFESVGAPVEVARNLARNPRGLDTGTYYEYASRYGWTNSWLTGQTPPFPGGPTTAGRLTCTSAQSGLGRGFDWGGNSDAANPGTSTSWLAYPVTAGVEIILLAWVRSNRSGLTGSIRLRFHDGAGNWVGTSISGATANLTGGLWSLVAHRLTVPAGATHVVGRSEAGSIAWAGGDTWDQTAVLISQTTDQYFDHLYYTPDDPDLVPAAVGTPGDSMSILRGLPVVGVTGHNCVVIRSTLLELSSIGGKAARLIPTSAGSNDSFAYMILPTGARDGGRIEGKKTQVAVLPPPAATRAGAVGVESGPGGGGAHYNVGGNTVGIRTHLTQDYPPLTSYFHARWYHATARRLESPSIGGAIWWQEAGIFSPGYVGDWFDGDHLPAGLDPALWRVRWLGTPGNSVSVLEGREVAPPTSEAGNDITIDGLIPGAEVTVWSSVDDGLTWELVESFTAVSSSALLSDPLLSHGQPMRWSAIQHQVVDGVRLPSERGVSDPVVPTSRAGILTSALAPASRWVRVHVRTVDPNVWPRPSGVHQLLREKYALVLRGTERGRRGALILRADDEAQRAVLHELTQCGDPLLLMMPPEADWAQTSIAPGERVTIRVVSEHSEPRIAQLPWQAREVPVVWVEARTPAVGEAPSQAPVTHPIIHL